MVCHGISDVVIASVYSEKTRLKTLMMTKMMMMMMMIIMNKSHEMTVFRVARNDFCYETKARKVMVDFKFGKSSCGWSWVCHPYVECATALSNNTCL